MEKARSWEWFRNEMQLMAERNEQQFQLELSLIEKCDSLVGDIFKHIGECGISNKPQNHVASILVTRAFRLAVSAVSLAVSGYPDSAPNLNRTIFEISMRFYDLKRDPIAAAYGFLLKGACDQIEIFKTMLESSDRTSPDTKSIEEKLTAFQKEYELYHSLARLNDLIPEDISKRYGHINASEACRKMGIEAVYHIDFAYMSSHIHERNMATFMFINENDDRCSFTGGPIENVFARPMAIEAIKKLAIVIGFCAELTGDEKSLEKAENLLKEILSLC